MASAAAGSSSAAAGSSSGAHDKMARLRALHLKMNEARKMNHAEVVEEDRRKKLPKNWEAKQKRVDWEEEEITKRKEAVSKGENYDRVKLLDVSAHDAERYEKAKRKKKNPDQGFSDYAQASFRQYQRLTKQLKTNMTVYDREKEKMGEAFYPEKDTLGVGEHKDSKEAIDKLVDDLDKQAEKRAKYSRRRIHDEEDDIDYINERNMNFNKKLERFYGKYTQEIKQNLERGTAV